MQRITQKFLEAQVSRLNKMAGHGENPKYSTPGAYCLDYAYGGVKLDQYCNESGGVRSAINSGFVSKRTLSELIFAFIAGFDAKV